MKMHTWLGALLSAAAIIAPASAQLDWTPAHAEAVVARLEAGDFGTVTSVLVLQGGEPVFERYFNGADAATLHNTRSVTKTITGMAVGAAVEDGLLDPDAPLAPLFSDIAPFENPDPRKEAITARDLLTMSGPLECNDWNGASRGNEERMYLVEDWPSFFWDLPIRGFPSWETPPHQTEFGRAFSYCTAGVQMLGEAVERAAGEPFTAYAERRVFAPAGVDGFEWSRNGQGQAHLGGGLLLTTRSLAAFGELQRLGGTVGGERVFSQAWAEASLTAQARINDDTTYGYLWWLGEADGPHGAAPHAYMSGNGGNRVWVLPDHGLTVVLTKTDFNTRGMHDQADLFFTEAILPALDE
ncbi:MAG: serine hydrolase [Oceanicaulis sp.]